MRRLLFIFALLLLPMASVHAAEVLDNAAVIRLVRSGLAGDVIVLKIERTDATFDTSAAALIDLKNANVPDAVIKAMLLKEPAAPAAAPAAPAPAPPAAANELCLTVDYFTNGPNGWGWTPANVCVSKSRISVDDDTFPIDQVTVHCIRRDLRASYEWQFSDTTQSYDFRGEAAKRLYDFLSDAKSGLRHGDCNNREIRSLLKPSPQR